MIEARYHDSVNVLQEMFAVSGDALHVSTPFERAEWFALLAETGLAPLITTARESKDMAALALTQSDGRLEPLRNWYSFSWRQIAPAGEAGDRLLAAIATQLRNRTHRVTLAPVPDEDGSASRLAQAFTKAGWRVEVTQCDTNHILRPRGRSFADYWSSRPGSLRTTLKRKGKRVEVALYKHFDAEAWADYETVYAASWKPTEGQPDMLRAFAQAEGVAGRLRLGIARHEGQAIAAQFWTVESGVAYIHKLAHLESHKQLSAGTTLSTALFEHVIDIDKVHLIDFGTGDESYKRDWMEDIRPRYQIDCLDMRQPRAWFDLTRLALGRLREPEVPALAPLPLDS